jgi:dTDP-glucose 4,6-dehydratase
MNIIGERQNAEKYVPLIINKLLRGEKLEIHAHPNKKQAGSRHYLHARNAAAALLFVVEHGEVGERYNVVGEQEIDNETLALTVTGYVNTWRERRGLSKLALNYELVDFHSARPGHDLRYALSSKKLDAMGYKHPVNFYDSLRKTVYWTLEHADKWL